MASPDEHPEHPTDDKDRLRNTRDGSQGSRVRRTVPRLEEVGEYLSMGRSRPGMGVIQTETIVQDFTQGGENRLVNPNSGLLWRQT